MGIYGPPVVVAITHLSVPLTSDPYDKAGMEQLLPNGTLHPIATTIKVDLLLGAAVWAWPSLEQWLHQAVWLLEADCGQNL